MLCHSDKLKTTVFITSFFVAATAFAQEPDGGVAPAPVELEEDATDVAPEPAPEPAPVEAAPAVDATASVSLTTTATADATAATDGAATTSGSAVMLGGETGPASSGGIDVGEGGWSFGFHGYFRAPFRMGMAKREPAQRAGVPTLLDTATDRRNPTVGGPVIPPPGSRQTVAEGGTFSYQARDYDPETAYKETTFHSPILPDDQYLTWQHTNHNSTDWAELFFTVGNSIAEGAVSVAGYNFTQSSFADPESQFGVAMAYATIKPPLPWDNVKVTAKVGSHWGRYGMAGRYDAGEYDTYLFGRTKVMGALLREQFQVGKVRLAFEEGFGGHRPHPSAYNTAKFTLLGHGHAFLEYKGLMAGLHLLHSWAQEEDRDGQGCPGPGGYDDDTGYPTTNSVCYGLWNGGNMVGSPGASPYGGGSGTVYPVGAAAGFGAFADGADGNVWLPDGSVTVFGPEVKWETGPFGLIYLGYALTSAKDSLTVSAANEQIHAYGGGEFALGVTNNYLDNPACNPSKGECSTGGNGKVHTLSAQYEFSLQNLLMGLRSGERFWGEGRDFVLKLYGMYNKVKSDYDVYLDGSLGAFERYGGLGHTNFWPTGVADPYPRFWAALGDKYSDHSKLKFGTDLYGSLFSSMAVGLRLDHLKPNNNLKNQAFSIISPRVEFRSRWVTREKITLQYSRYIYAQRECPTLTDYNPYEPLSDTSGGTGAGTYDFSGSPQNFSGQIASQDCAQIPSGPRLPDGFGATQLETGNRGAPITGGNPNNPRPDENVFKIEASMWW